MSEFLQLLTEETARSRLQHGVIRTPHEAYGLLLIEVNEFRAEVMKNPAARCNLLLLTILTGVMIVAKRAIEDLSLEVPY